MVWFSVVLACILVPIIIFGGLYRYIMGYHCYYPDFIYDFFNIEDREDWLFFQGFIGCAVCLPIFNILSVLALCCFLFSKWITSIRERNIEVRELCEKEKRRMR